MAVVKIPFDRQPDEQAAIARAANVKLPEDFYALPAAKRATAFTVSGLARLDQVQAVADALATMQATGGTFHDFKKWAAGQDWSLPKHRMETIYRNAVQTSYMAGHWRAFSEQAETFPYLMYDAINDSRTRPSHLALDGVIRPVGDPFWKTRTPPLGHRCRCTLRALLPSEARERGGVTQNPPIEGQPDKGWGSDPREWDDVLKRLGEEKVVKAPEAVRRVWEEIAKPGPDGVGGDMRKTAFGEFGDIIDVDHDHPVTIPGHGHAARRMVERGMTPADIQNVVKNATWAFSQGTGKTLFIASTGAVVLMADGRMVTAYPEGEFDESMKDLLERLGGIKK